MHQAHLCYPVRLAEKTSRNTVPANLLWEKNTVPSEKKTKKYGLQENEQGQWDVHF